MKSEIKLSELLKIETIKNLNNNESEYHEFISTNESNYLFTNSKL